MNNEDDVYFYSSSSKSAIGDRATSRFSVKQKELRLSTSLLCALNSS
jgi:hypothetical protein